MAKQTGAVRITGTRGNICFYKMQGKYYARIKSSLTRKRVKQDPAFERTRQNASIFGEANKIASLLYFELPKADRGKAVRYELIRRARKLLAEGMSKEKILHILKSRKEKAVADGTEILRRVFKEVHYSTKEETEIIYLDSEYKCDEPLPSFLLFSG